MPKSGSLQDLLTLSLSQQIPSPCRYASRELLKDMQGSGQHPVLVPGCRELVLKATLSHSRSRLRSRKNLHGAGAESAQIKEYKSRQGLQSVSLSVCPSVCLCLSLYVVCVLESMLRSLA